LQELRAEAPHAAWQMSETAIALADAEQLWQQGILFQFMDIDNFDVLLKKLY